ncbi:hypothetical protein EV361DRAFT_793549 [Lentinula raphanica]|uniref:Uncharacterized protein n=1 Tax=Lentinula raphanica TaxID=153919 RepID=A0AA38UG96_9AGAR|nr:hypothetical protein F5878DRAFT_534310 [Lentinula raphanica]KAJ3974787.1 hypothetical protein EV361DRAFT_793549 [Lentinula raphanica]
MSAKLSTITEWADRRTAAVYTAKSKALAKDAIQELFAPHVKASINGRKITRDEIDQLLLDMRPTEEGPLGFYWTDLVGTPRDPSHRDGSVSGVFIISGLRLPHPHSGQMVPTFRRKGVAVSYYFLLIFKLVHRIESQSQDPAIDSRRIVEFVAVANNYPLDQLATQEEHRSTYTSQYGYKL